MFKYEEKIFLIINFVEAWNNVQIILTSITNKLHKNTKHRKLKIAI